MIGHNLDFDHSGKEMYNQDWKNEIADRTCTMGSPSTGLNDQGLHMCFSGSKTYWTNWYADHQLSIKPHMSSFNGDLVGIADVVDGNNVREEHNVVVRIRGPGEPDLFVMYQRKKGVIRDIPEDGDRVVITEQDAGYSQSWWLDSLGEGESYEWVDWMGEGSLIVKVCSINIGTPGVPDTAHVIMYLDGVTYEECPTDPRTVSPTPSPTLELTDEPTMEPTMTPIDSITQAPTIVNSEEKRDPGYVEISSKNCEEFGYETIFDEDECIKAAKAVSRTISSDLYSDYEDVVDGCSARIGTEDITLFVNPKGTCDPNASVNSLTYTGCKCTDWMPCFCRDSNISSTNPTKPPSASPTIQPTFLPTINMTEEPTPADSNENPDALFLVGFNNDDTPITQSCSWLNDDLNDDLKEKVCMSKWYQLYSDEFNLSPAFLVCPVTCAKYCIIEKRISNFLFDAWVNDDNSSHIETRKCQWLMNRPNNVIEEICNTSIDAESIYGQASEVCPETCRSCPEDIDDDWQLTYDDSIQTDDQQTPNGDIFLIKFDENGDPVSQTCDVLSEMNKDFIRKVCRNKRYQVYSEEHQLSPASQVCTKICDGYCVDESSFDKFVIGETNSGAARTQTCHWLGIQIASTRETICGRIVDADSIYGQASEVCTRTCQTC
jgi:hypothetical protein